MDRKSPHAVVIGGSMAGMLAARVLSDYYEHVTIIDRDYMPNTVEQRDGTPQAKHLHIFLAKGLQIVQDLFPGIDQEMTAHGATVQHWGRETVNYLERGWMPAFESSLKTRGISRILLEWCVRQRLRENERIQFMERTQVKQLLTRDNNATLIGVEVHPKGVPNQTTKITADLVVDASGRGSESARWLVEMGYEQIQETVINSFLGYATRWYKRPANFPKNLKILTVQSVPKNPRGGVIMEVEDNTIIVTVSGSNKDYPPTDEAGFLEFAKSLISPAIYNLIRDAEPLSKIYGYQRTENRWRHYERFSRWPDQFIVLGDAACAFNPIYGQGMTTGALEAVALGEILKAYAGKNETGMAKAFQERLAKVIETPWLMATGEDLRYPGTEGGQVKWQDRIVQKYIERYINAMALYPEIIDPFVQVMNLLQPPTTLFRPSTIIKVVSSRFRKNIPINNSETIPLPARQKQMPLPQ